MVELKSQPKLYHFTNETALNMHSFSQFIFYCEIQLGTTILWIRFLLFHRRITSGLVKTSILVKTSTGQNRLVARFFYRYSWPGPIQPSPLVLVDCLKFCFIGVLRQRNDGRVEWTYNIKEGHLVDLIQCISRLISLIVKITRIC